MGQPHGQVAEGSFRKVGVGGMSRGLFKKRCAVIVNQILINFVYRLYPEGLTTDRCWKSQNRRPEAEGVRVGSLDLASQELDQAYLSWPKTILIGASSPEPARCHFFPDMLAVPRLQV